MFPNFRANEWLEYGSLLIIALKIEDSLMHKMKKNTKVYETLEDFVADVSSNQDKLSPNVKLENIKNLFFYFAAFLMAVSLVCITHIFLFDQLAALTRKLTFRPVVLGVRFGEGFFSRMTSR